MKLVPLFGTQMKQKLNCINDKTIANGQIIATLCNTLALSMNWNQEIFELFKFSKTLSLFHFGSIDALLREEKLHAPPPVQITI